MITGVRLTQLEIGEPLIGAAFEYKNLKGIDAVEKRLEDLFYEVKSLGFNYVIDTVIPQLDLNGNLTFTNNGLYGGQWLFERRMELYQRFSKKAGVQVLLCLDFPTDVTEDNYQAYADFFIDNLVQQYDWVKSWQIMVYPDTKDVFSNFKCSPVTYVKFLRYIYPKIKALKNNVRIGGPGIRQSFIDYLGGDFNGWFSQAIGNKFVDGDTEYTVIGDKGILPYIDFFSIYGNQDNTVYNYATFTKCIDTLNVVIFNKMNKYIPIYSLSQGHTASTSVPRSLKEQGYYDLSEMLNCFKRGVVPCKNQLIDEYYDPNVYNGKFDANRLNYGLMYYYMGASSYKPAYDEIQFVLTNLSGFETVTTDAFIADLNPNIDSVTLTNSAQDVTATVFWSTTLSNQTLVLQPKFTRSYILPNGNKTPLNDIVEISFETNHFVIVYEKKQKYTIDIQNLEKRINRKLNHFEESLTAMLDCLTSKYPTDVRDTNFYRILRSVAVEMSDARVELDEIKDNMYLETVHPDFIYNNFGVMVRLAKKPEWSDEKYRNLIKGVTKSLLNGPTKKSITQALQLFTNFKVTIHELYKEMNLIDPAIMAGKDPQFTFVVEIEKPADDTTDQAEVYGDVINVLNIIKPAHTLNMIIVTLSADENYREQFYKKHKIKFEESDQYVKEAENEVKEGIYGWRYKDDYLYTTKDAQNRDVDNIVKGYTGVFTTANTGVLSNASLTNGAMMVGPRYVLFDDAYATLDLFGNEDYHGHVQEQILTYLERPYDSETYHDVLESDLIEFNQDLSETKFGVDDSQVIQLNGGELGNKILNLFRLGVGTKLSDEWVFDYEHFFNDKYVFRNTLRSLRFNLAHGFNSKFAVNPDQATIFHFEQQELTFRKKIVSLTSGEQIVVERLKEEIPEVELDFLHEPKFGTITDNVIQENPQLNNDFEWEDNGKCLNLNVLGIGSKLDDDLLSELEESYCEIDILRRRNSLLDAFMLDVSPLNPQDETQYKFWDGILVEQYYMDVELHEETKPYEELHHAEIERFLDESYEVKNNEYEVSLGIYQEQYDTIAIKNIYEIDTMEFDTWTKPVGEELGTIELDVNLYEYYRERELGPENEYHMHKKIVNVLTNRWNYIVLPPTDLFTAKTEYYDSLTRVYVNGMLMPYWAYDELVYPLDLTRAYGVRVHDDVIMEGDVITVLYLKDRSIIIKDFPIRQDLYTALDTFKEPKYEPKDDSFVPDYINSDIIEKPIIDQTEGMQITVMEIESYKPANESVCFEGSEFCDFVDFNHSVAWNERFMLNAVPLNMGRFQLFDQDHSDGVSGVMVFENFDKTTIEHTTKVTISIPFDDKYETKGDLPEFGSYWGENNIVKDLNIENNIVEIGTMVTDKYTAKLDELHHIDIAYFNYDKYKTKDDHLHSECIMPTNEDIIDMMKIKEIIAFNMEVFDTSNIGKKDEFIYKATINYYERFDKSKIVEGLEAHYDHFKLHHKLQDNLRGAFKFCSSRNWAVNFNQAVFADVPVINNENYEVALEQKIDLQQVQNVVSEIDQEAPWKEKYKPKTEYMLVETDKSFNDKFNLKRDNDHMVISKADDFNHEYYEVKNMECLFEMYRVHRDNTTEIIKVQHYGY